MSIGLGYISIVSLMRIFKPPSTQSSSMDEELERLRAKRMEEIKQRIMTPPSGHEGILIITQENFSRIVRENPNLIVDFWAPWCGPCKMLSPVLEELQAEYGDSIVVYKVNTDEEQELAAVFGIRSIPSLLFIPMNEKPQMTQGAMGKGDLKKAIDTVLLHKK